MKKLYIAATLLLSAHSWAQISEGGMPASFSKTFEGLETNVLESEYQIVDFQTPNLTTIFQEDLDASEKGKPYRIGTLLDAQLSIQNSGTWTTLDNGDKVWRLGIRVPEANALSLFFQEGFNIPVGGKLFAYNEKRSQYVGAYTSNTPQFQAMELIQGELLTLEYIQPANSNELPNFLINKIAYSYRGLEGRMSVFQDSDRLDQDRTHGSCEVDVACDEIDGWEEQRDAVVSYTFVSGSSMYVCSGSVINNTSNDCTPYVLTANHCGEPTADSDITNHTFYFNYQRSTCTPGNTASYTGAQSQTMSGGTLKASSQLGNQTATSSTDVSGSDFVLIELSTDIPSTYNPYFAGWNRSTTAATSGVGIHHPAGDEKKVSTYSSSLSTATYNSGWTGAHWRVYWVSTTNGHGVTEGGSSGSPIFDQSGYIVGHLSGGSSYCSAPNDPDLYGKFVKAWDGEGTNDNQMLEPWLDPTGTGVTSLAGTYMPCSGSTTDPGTGTGDDPCTGTSTDCDEYIANVTFNTIDNASTCDNYGDYRSVSTTVTPGLTYTLTITPGTVASGTGYYYTGDQFGAWIDWNGDGDFDDTNEEVGYGLATATNVNNTFDVTVPLSLSVNGIVMRVRISYEDTDGTLEPCGSTTYGEVEDYTINILGLGIEDNEQDKVAIYPNPTTGKVMVNLNGAEVEQIEVRDISGRMILNETNISQQMEFDLEDVPAGVYFISVYTTQGVSTQKLVKE